MHSPSARRALCQLVEKLGHRRMTLLVQALSTLQHAQDLPNGVPTPGITPDELMAYEMVGWLETRGLVGQDLFDLLVAEHPACEAEVRAVQRQIQRTVLFLSAAPAQLPPIQVVDEARSVIDTIRACFAGGELGLVVKHDVRVEDWRRNIELLRPTLLHFSGHGDAWGLPVLQGEAGAGATPPVEPLLDQLRGAGLQGAVFNACDSGRLAEAAVTRAGLPWAIGAERRVPDQTAMAFARGFYEGLALGRAPREAFEAGVARCRWDGVVRAEVLRLYGQG